ncbi:MAG: flavodoxin-dependent (E)-4-hydroxy-3-methylbut-2-enyl-diphosphate synthase [Pseudomonadota bacterium]
MRLWGASSTVRGEAKEADIGIAGGRGKGLIFKKGEKVGVYPESELLPTLLAEIERITGERVIRGTPGGKGRRSVAGPPSGR